MDCSRAVDYNACVQALLAQKQRILQNAAPSVISHVVQRVGALDLTPFIPYALAAGAVIVVGIYLVGRKISQLSVDKKQLNKLTVLSNTRALQKQQLQGTVSDWAQVGDRCAFRTRAAQAGSGKAKSTV